MPRIIIDPEFQSYIPRQSEQEHKLLEKNIILEGCRDPLVVWQRGKDEEELILLDGHNRYSICRKHDIKFSRKVMAFESREQALAWIIDNQLGRRNLTLEQMHYFRGQRYNLEKAATSNPRGVNQHTGVDLQKEDQPPTHKRLAEEFNTSPSTIERDGKFAAAVDTLAVNAGPDARRKILSAQTGLRRKDIHMLARHLTPDEQKELLESDKAQIKQSLKDLNQKLTPPVKAPKPDQEPKQQNEEEAAEEDQEEEEKNAAPEEAGQQATAAIPETAPADAVISKCHGGCMELVHCLTMDAECAARLLRSYYDPDFLTDLVKHLSEILEQESRRLAGGEAGSLGQAADNAIDHQAGMEAQHVG